MTSVKTDGSRSFILVLLVAYNYNLQRLLLKPSLNKVEVNEMND